MAASPAPSASPTLRVMRLYKPKLYVDKRGGAPGATRLTSALVLPDSFGNIYKGETFFAYVSVLNAEDAPSPTLLDVAVSAKLQAPCAKRAVELKDTSERRRAEARADGVDPDSWRSPDMPPTRRRANPAAELRGGENVDMIVEHALGECGTHTLRVSVSYRLAGDGGPPDGRPAEPRSLRKFYRFNVLDPLECTPRAWLLPRAAGARYEDRYADGEASSNEPPLGVVEVAVKNSMQERCVLDAVTLHCAPGFASREITARDGRIVEVRGGAAHADRDRPSLLDGYADLARGADDRAAPPPRPPFEGFAGKITDMDPADVKELLDFDPLALYDAKCHLEPGDVVTKLFTVHRAARPAAFLTGETPRDDDGDVDEPTPDNAGFLKLSWCAAMGEGGSVTTPAVDWPRRDALGEALSQAQRDVERRFAANAPPDHEGLRPPLASSTPEPLAPADARRQDGAVVFVELRGLPRPRSLYLYEAVDCVCAVTNRGDRDLTLQLQWRLADMPAGVTVYGKCYTNLGVVAAGATARAPVKLLPVQGGLHQLTGCYVLDLVSQHEFPIPNLADVVVWLAGVVEYDKPEPLVFPESDKPVSRPPHPPAFDDDDAPAGAPAGAPAPAADAADAPAAAAPPAPAPALAFPEGVPALTPLPGGAPPMPPPIDYPDAMPDVSRDPLVLDPSGLEAAVKAKLALEDAAHADGTITYHAELDQPLHPPVQHPDGTITAPDPAPAPDRQAAADVFAGTAADVFAAPPPAPDLPPPPAPEFFGGLAPPAAPAASDPAAADLFGDPPAAADLFGDPPAK